RIVLRAGGDEAHALFAGQQLLLGRLALADVHEGHDHAVDLVRRSTIRQQARKIPATVDAAHFAFRRPQVLDRILDIGQQVRIGQAVRDVGQRAPDIAADQVEQL
nr:hypothetical protein [Tanacetum cinerariifolium]